MSDRTSAGIFGDVFLFLAQGPIDRRTKKFARQMWERAANCDFSWDQMGVDEALKKLGLAKMGIDPKYPEDGEHIIYRGEAGFDP